MRKYYTKQDIDIIYMYVQAKINVLDITEAYPYIIEEYYCENVIIIATKTWRIMEYNMIWCYSINIWNL